jgi:hypothetical protein
VRYYVVVYVFHILTFNSSEISSLTLIVSNDNAIGRLLSNGLSVFL